MLVVIEEKDPDVTQLEIDICSTSISNSQISKKRQLIIMDDDENIQPNALIYPFSKKVNKIFTTRIQGRKIP